MADSISASLDSPLALSPATACACVTPADSFLLKTPAVRVFIALPRILGPRTERVTLTAASSSTTTMRARSGLSMPTMRLRVPRKSLAVSVGLASAPAGPPPPGPCCLGGGFGVWSPRGPLPADESD